MTVTQLDGYGRRGASRVSPHNLQAEENLLGAMLLARDAIAAAAEVVRPADFYKPAHVHIFDAILGLYGSGEPVDPITVADELARAGTLDAIGGPNTLVGLQANAPAISNAGHYAHIVEELALLRRMISAAGEIAELGYSMPDDVEKAVDSAERMIFDLAERRNSGTTASIGSLLGGSLDRLEQLAERGETITGVPTGYIDFDELTSGFQPGQLIVVGARPSAGKALALNTLLPTPTGWTTMGDVQVGDRLIDEAGSSCAVMATTAVQHGRDCYRVTFDDGSTIVADADHQWFAYDLPAWKSKRGRHDRLVAGPPPNPHFAVDQSARWKHPRVVTTRQMLNEGVRVGKDRRPNWYLPLAAAIDGPEIDLPADPYILGCWLGDGKTSSSEITVGDEDIAHFKAEFEASGYPLEWRYKLQYATVPVPGNGAYQGYRGPLRILTRELQQVGLLGWLHVARKHIPAIYMRASAKQRLALLQGIMDTDGTVSRSTGAVELCLANPDLLARVRELVCSLGEKPGQVRRKVIPLPDGRQCEAWRMTWTPHCEVFRMERKAARLRLTGRVNGRSTRRAITSIAKVPSVPVRCITVDSPNSLYLAGESMIPTHNTAWALTAATHAALVQRRPVLFFSLEMSQLEMAMRMLCSEARVDATRMRNGKLNESDWQKISYAVDSLADAPFWIDDNPNVTVIEIRSKARKLKAQQGDLGLVVVDYVTLMTGRAGAQNRQVEVAEISRSLKILARELECPVVVLAQLNRGLEQRADKRPMLSDLRESGSLEQDADVVVMLYRDEMYNRDSLDQGVAEVNVAKQRSGPTGMVRLAFLGQYMRFASMARN